MKIHTLSFLAVCLSLSFAFPFFQLKSVITITCTSSGVVDYFDDVDVDVDVGVTVVGGDVVEYD